MKRPQKPLVKRMANSMDYVCAGIPMVAEDRANYFDTRRLNLGSQQAGMRTGKKAMNKVQKGLEIGTRPVRRKPNSLAAKAILKHKMA